MTEQQAVIREGFNYTCRDGETVKPKKQINGDYKCERTGRWFTETGECIGYYRGDVPIPDPGKSIIPSEVERISKIETGPNYGTELQGGREPPITNEERLSSGMIKPR